MPFIQEHLNNEVNLVLEEQGNMQKSITLSKHIIGPRLKK